MPVNGMESRQEQRSSFAFDTSAPAQSRASAASGLASTGQVSVQGGHSQSGVVSGSPVTLAGPDAAQWGDFLSDFMAPYVARRRQEAMVRGMVDQMNGVSTDEIKEDKSNPLNAIFGPSAYQEGAVFYNASSQVGEWQRNMLSDPDLKKLPPEELSKVINESITKMQTGDPTVDTPLMTKIFEATGPVVAAISKEGYKWRQEQARDSHFKDVSLALGNFQKLAVSFSGTQTDSNGEEVAGLRAAHAALRSSLQKLSVEDDDTYVEVVKQAYLDAARNGSGYAINVLNQEGFLDVLGADGRLKVEDQAKAYMARAKGDVILNDPELDKLSEMIDEAEIRGDASPQQVADLYRQFNDVLANKTGDRDNLVFDWKDIRAGRARVISSIQRKADQATSFKQSLYLQNLRQEAEDRKEAEKTAAAAAYYKAGNLAEGVASGDLSSDQISSFIADAYNHGNIKQVVRDYRKGFVSSNLSKQLQASIDGFTVSGYSKGFEQTFQLYQQMQQQSPAMAKAYYGQDIDLRLRRFGQLRQTMPASKAFDSAFSGMLAAGGNSSGASTQVQKWWDSNKQQGWLSRTLTGGTQPNPLMRSRVVQQLGREAGQDMALGDGRSAAEIVGTAYEAAVNSGTVEDYGSVAWTNRRPRTPLKKWLGVNDEEVGNIVRYAVNYRLGEQGRSVDDAHYTVSRINDNNNKPALLIEMLDSSNVFSGSAIVHWSDLERTKDYLRKQRAQKYQPGGRRMVVPRNGVTGPHGAPDYTPRTGAVPAQRKRVPAGERK